MASDEDPTVVGGPGVAASDLRSLDALLDAALADSFPASDPPALVLPHGGRRSPEARAGRQARRRGGPGIAGA